MVYFLAKSKFKEFEKFLEEMAKLPRDAELDADAVIVAFCKAYGIDPGGISGSIVDIGKFAGIGLEWMAFMGGESSPSRKLKIDSVVSTPGSGGPGGGPGGPGDAGPGFPGAPGGPPGRPPGGGGPDG